LRSIGRGRGSRRLWPTMAPTSWAWGIEWMARDAEERKGIAKEGSPAVEVSGRHRFSKRGGAWPAGGSVAVRRRCSRGRPTTGTSRICAARPCGALGVVVFTWRCFVAANRQGQRQRRRRLTRLQRRRRGAQGAFPRRPAQGRGAARLNRARRRQSWRARTPRTGKRRTPASPGRARGGRQHRLGWASRRATAGWLTGLAGLRKLRGVAAAWRKKWGATARLRLLGRKQPRAENEERKKEKASFLFSENIFVKEII
jgi:hypothetical protein